jgi:hypothetical protein
MADVISAVVDPLLKKYGIPVWVKPYLKEYVKSDPVNAIKRATSFIDVKRKKGQVTNNSVVLPNNTAFKTESVVGIVSLFSMEKREAYRLQRNGRQNQTI